MPDRAFVFPRAALQGGGEVTVWLEPNKVSRTPRHALAMDLTWLGNDGEPVEGGMFDKTGEKPVVVLADASGVQVNCLDTASSGSDFGGICINDAAVTPRDALEPAAGGDEPSAGAPGPTVQEDEPLDPFFDQGPKVNKLRLLQPGEARARSRPRSRGGRN